MKILPFIFLIIQTHEYFFEEFIQNDTYINDYHLQAPEKTSVISNKVLVVIIVCVSIVLIAIFLIIYFTKEQIKDFISRMRTHQRGVVIHQFHPVVRLPPSIHDKNQQIPSLAANIKSKSVNESGKQQRTSIHAFINPSNTRQPDATPDCRYSQSAANLFLYH